MSWLPSGKRAAVCFSVDDVHPAPVAEAALAHVRWLQERHPQLRATFFTTPAWRSRAPYPTRKLLARLPFVRERIFTVPVLPRDTFRLDRHESFCALLRDWRGAEVGLHGLHHVRTGTRPVQEFAGRTAEECRAILDEAMALFERARLPIVRGMTPPGWDAPPPLLAAMGAAGLRFVASARDLDTPVAPDAVTDGSGLRGLALIRPQRIEHGLLHIPVNFQATSALERAMAILDAGGLLSIKAHLLAELGPYRALDGLTAEYREHLHRLFGAIEERYGDAVWWTSMGELAA